MTCDESCCQRLASARGEAALILIGNQRGGARDLSRHLLKPDNDRVEVHELRGFIAEDLHGALQESYAVSRATRCKQHLYSLSLNPPKDAQFDDVEFVETVDRIETALGLTDQPRAIVFHEKNGRRHAHAVWSRIDIEQGRAIHLPFTKNKLQDISRDIYIERGWQMPRGFVDRDFVDPRNFTLAEWQQAKRAEKDPKKLKGFFQDSWAISDCGTSFSHALETRGFYLARGDRRGFIAVDHTGEAFSLSRWIGVKPKNLKARLGAPDNLPSKDEAHVKAARTITTRLEDLKSDLQKQDERKRQEFEKAQTVLNRERQQAETRLINQHALRTVVEKAQREARLRCGIMGFWDRVTGKRQRVEARNALEAEQSRDRNHIEIVRLRRAYQDAEKRNLVLHASKQQERKNALKNLKADIKTLSHSSSPPESGLETKVRSMRKRRKDRQRNRSP